MRRVMAYLLFLVLFLPLNGCSDDSSSVCNTPDGFSEIDQEILNNFMIIRNAVEEQYKYDRYIYPDDLSRSNGNGDSVIDLLPGGVLLPNPISGIKDVPMEGIPSIPGQIGYLPDPRTDGRNYGYILTAIGEDGEILYQYISLGSEEEARVRRNAHNLWEAITYYSWENNNVFPRDLNTDTNTVGKTAMDYLASPFVNPYTDETYDPDIEYPYTVGNIRFIPKPSSGDVTDGVVVGIGDMDGKTVAEFYLMWWEQ